MNIKISKIFLLILFIIAIVLVVININVNKDTAIGVNAEVLSGKKIEWGIKRSDNNTQPDVGNLNKQLMEDSNSIYMGNKDKKIIYLTFDNGYEAGYTEDILNTLKQNDVTATFFVTEHYVNTAEDMVRKMIENENIVGNHTAKHKSMPGLDEETLKNEVSTLHNLVKEKFNYEMKYLRPPKGEYSEKSLALTSSLGYKTVMWSFAYADWDENDQPSAESAKKKIYDNLHNGEVMLLHATSKTNRDILDEVIKEIKNKGYEIKSISEFE